MSTSNAALQTEMPDLNAIKAKQKATWEDGDYAIFSRYMEDGAIELLECWNISNDKTLLDIGCGSGQTAIPAAKRGIRVTGIDIAENLVRHARERSELAMLNARFDVGDAEDLPYENKKFNAVISLFGAMFAPRPKKVVSEVARVLEPGGKLYMANWTPDSMPAQMFKRVAEIVSPPAGFISPVLWGDEETVKQRLANEFTDIKLTRKIYPQWHYPFDAKELVHLFRTYFGPVKRAFDIANEQQQKALKHDLETIYRNNSEVNNHILTITGGEVLEVIATRR